MEKLDLFNVMENSRRVCLSNLLIAVVFLCVFHVHVHPGSRTIGTLVKWGSLSFLA